MLTENFVPWAIKKLHCNYSSNVDGGSPSGGSSDILGSIFQGVSAVTNTAILANANPVNTALLTNRPIATPYASTGIAAAMPSSSLLWVGILLIVGFVIFGSMRN